MENRGRGEPTSSAPESHASESAQQVMAEDSLTKTITRHSCESFAKWNPDTFSWRTHHCFLFEDYPEFSGKWPRWGSMQGGECWALTMPDFLISATASGEYLPTPSGTSNHGKNHVSGRLDEWGGSGNIWRKTEIGKLHCPRFEEWMMGWPDQWTALMPLETDKFLSVWLSHGKSLTEEIDDLLSEK